MLVSISNHNQHCVAKAALLDVLRDLFHISSAELLRPWHLFGIEKQAGFNDFAKVLKSSCHSGSSAKAQSKGTEAKALSAKAV